MVVSVPDYILVPAGYGGLWSTVRFRMREGAYISLRGGTPGEFLSSSSLLLDDMPKLAVGHRRQRRLTSSALPMAKPHANSRVFSTYLLVFFFSHFFSSRNHSRVARSLSPSSLLLSSSDSFCRLTFRTCISTYNPSLYVSLCTT